MSKSKPKRTPARPSVSVVLDAAQLSSIDALAEGSSTPWHRTSRAEVLRTFVNQGLARLPDAEKRRTVRKAPLSSGTIPPRRRRAAP
jgi:hypothetical protein